MSLLYVIGGILFLYLGGELLVHGAVQIARSLGIRQLIIGLTVVAFGTSSPELAASLFAAFRDAHDVVLGNIVGSNILNIGVVLGLSALILPLTTDALFLRREVPFMIGTGALLFLLIPDGAIGRLEGLLLLTLLCLYLVVLYRERKGGEDWGGSTDTGTVKMRPVGLSVLEIAAGTALLTGGALGLVTGAVEIAESYGVSQRIIGLTMVAFGTSLPELASCMVACLRRHGSLILGSLVGSSIFNVLAILGVTAIVHPIGVASPTIVSFDLGIMTGFGVAVLLLMARGLEMKRWEGGVLLGLYFVYVVYLFM